MEQVKPVGTKARLVFWLPPDEAARHFGVSRAELTSKVRSGRLTMRAKVAGGELVATLCSTDLIAEFGPPKTQPKKQLSSSTGRQSDFELSQLHGELVAEREAVHLLELDRARLEGQLDTANRIERGLQRYADKLEGKLDQAETLRLNLARAVGQLEAEARRLQQQLEASTGSIEPARLTEGRARKKRRRWFGRG